MMRNFTPPAFTGFIFKSTSFLRRSFILRLSLLLFILSASLCNASSSEIFKGSPANIPMVYSFSAGDPAGCGSFVLYWSGNGDRYFLDVATTPTFDVGTKVYDNVEKGNIGSLNIIGLSQNTTYYFRIKACNSSGCSTYYAGSYKTIAVPAPVASAGSVKNCNGWLAQWQKVYNNNVTGYLLDVSKFSDFRTYLNGYQSLNVGDVQDYTITGLEPGGTYFYRLRALGACGTSAYSNTITFVEKGDGSSIPGTISGGDQPICVGFTTQFSVTGSWPSNGVWSVFNQTGAATVSKDGVVTGVTEGMVKVVFTTKNGTCTTSTSKDLLILKTPVAGTASSEPTVCMNSVMTAITHSTTGATGIGTVDNLPTGVTASWSDNLITISGSPTVSGTFSYKIQLAGGCGTVNATGKITVLPTLTAPKVSITPATCYAAGTAEITNYIDNNTYTFSPAGPTVGLKGIISNLNPGTYTVTVSNSACTSTSTSFTVAAQLPAPSLSLASEAGTSGQAVCIGTSVSPITYRILNATVAEVSGLPSGITGTYKDGALTISGKTAVAGSYTYTVTATGSCGSAAVTGMINILPVPTAAVLAEGNPQICTGADASFRITGTPGATVSYKLNETLKSVALSEAGVAVVKIQNISADQTLQLVSVSNGTCSVSLNASTTIVTGKKSVYRTTTGWSNGIPNDNGLHAVIADHYNTAQSGGFKACDCTVNSGAVLTVAANTSITLTNGIANGGSIVVESDANLIQTNNAAVNTGNITVKRDSKMSRLDYIYWGTPVSGQALGAFSPATVANRFYSYNEQYDSFSVIPSLTQPMVAHKGYVIRAPNNFAAYPAKQNFTGVFTGVPNNGEVIVPVSYTDATRGKNLVGNPYPSNIDLEKLTDDNLATASGVYYFWTNFPDFDANANAPVGQYGNYSSNHYATYNSSGGVASARNNQKPSGIIKPGQGFLYQAKAAGVLTFNNSMRTDATVDRFNSTSIFISNKGKTGDDAPQPERYWLKLTTPVGNYNSLLIAYVEGATNGFEARYDATFPVSSSDRFYSISEGKDLIIQGRQYPFAATDVVPLGMSHFVAGEYKIEMAEKEGVFANGQAVYLKDTQTGIITDLSAGSYTYTASAGESTNRFEISYEPGVVLATNGSTLEEIKVYRDAADFVIKAQTKKITGLEVYDTSGKLIYALKPNSTKAVIEAAALVNGMYLIKIDQSGKVTSRKVLK